MFREPQTNAVSCHTHAKWNTTLMILMDSMTDGHEMNKHETLKTISSRSLRGLTNDDDDVILQSGC